MMLFGKLVRVYERALLRVLIEEVTVADITRAMAKSPAPSKPTWKTLPML